MKNEKAGLSKELEDIDKAQAAVMKTMGSSEKQGNVFLPVDDLMRRCRSQHTYLSREQVLTAVTELQRKKLYVDGKIVARTETEEAENGVARVCAQRLSMDNSETDADWEAYIRKAENMFNVILSESQRKAAIGALSCKTAIITGGAGAGKTTLLQVISEAYLSYCKAQDDKSKRGILDNVLLMAPTGKAARRLSAQVSLPAYTIDSVVYTADSNRNSTFYGDDQHFSYPLIIIDEGSMLDMEHMYQVMEGLSPETKMILVGDPAQLPSVGPGLVLRDLMASGIPVFALTDNFRLVSAKTALAHDIDCIRDGRDELIMDDSFCVLNAGAPFEVGTTMIQIYAQLVNQGKDVQMLSPTLKAPCCGTEPLNHYAQRLLNPATPDNRGIEINGTVFRVGDRIVQLQNNKYGRNGDTGSIVGIEQCDQPVFHVQFDTDNRASYPAREIAEKPLLAHAYALTVHKAQGSEYDYVLIPLVSSQGFMWTQNMIYTAVSRARKGVVFVGQESILKMAIRRPLPLRNTDLLLKINALRKQNIA